MHRRSEIFLALLLVSLLAASLARAQSGVPPALEPWRSWVLAGEEYRSCPARNDSAPDVPANHICAWPGELSIEADRTGARFSQPWQLAAAAWVPLPGDAQHWPSSVTADGTAVAVVAQAGRPSVRLAPGTHRLSGALSWTERPASLAVPAETGLIALTLDGAVVARPELEGLQLWLGPRPSSDLEADRLSIAVYRRLSDGVPVRLETRARLEISGARRELALSGALLPQFTALDLRSALPALLDQQGVLHVQLRPGRYELVLDARAAPAAATFAVPNAIGPWPAEELWSYEGNPQLRVAALEGAQALDAAQAGVPPEWQNLPSFRVTAGSTLALTERSRNDAEERNQLMLARELWLDFSGRAFTSRDRVGGTMRRGWRLDVATPYRYMSGEDNGGRLLVTDGDSPDITGVELRAADVSLVGTLRIDRTSRIPITGYRDAFQSVQTLLHLPPNYRLLAAPGADRASEAWVDRFTLLDLFLVLIIGVGVWRLYGRVAGIVALAALALAFHEPGAPRWMWLNLLLATGLLRVAPQGWLRQITVGYRNVSALVLIVLLALFAGTELRSTVFPQLEPTGYFAARGPEGPQGVATVAGTARQLDQLLKLAEPQASTLEQAADAGIAAPGYTRYPPGALVQTGPGIPAWQWSEYRLSWNGPVTPEQEFRPVIVGPVVVTLWRIASVALMLLLAALLLREDLPRLPTLAAWRASSGTAAAVLTALLLGAASVCPRGALAQGGGFPSPELLQELKRRLTEPAPCAPSCAELTHARIVLDDEALTATLELALEDEVAVPLPGERGSWRPERVDVDGARQSWLYRSEDGRLWTGLAKGVHRVVLRGAVPIADAFSLAFPLPPRGIEVTAPGWDVGGLAGGRLAADALELARREPRSTEESPRITQFAPFASVTRTLSLDLDWQVTTTVERIAPRSGAFTLALDLLPGEALLSPEVELRDGKALVAFTSDADHVTLQSRLPTGSALTLTAPSASPWTETWALRVAPLWHVVAEGLPSSPPARLDPGFYVPEYHPRPGEALTLTVERPAPAAGVALAIDRVMLASDAGERSSDASLTFDYRSTRGGQHALTLPVGAELVRVAIDGRELPLGLDGPTLALPVQPGEHHVELAWRSAAASGWYTRLPDIDLGAPASNLHLSLRLPGDRWVLGSFGPTLGPAVLYWSELLLFALAAMILGRLKASPLRASEWLLLGLGLSTFAWSVLLLFALWAFALSWRGRTQIAWSAARYNALQVVIGALTVITLLALIGAIPLGLLGQPNMQIASPVEPGALAWFADQSAGTMPRAGAISISLWFYRAAMLAWALWLSFALLRWLPWAWRSFAHEGLWRGPVARRAA